MRLLAAVVVSGLALSLVACGGGDDESGETSAAEQAEQSGVKAVRCSQRSFRVAFDPEGTVVVSSADDTLASVTDTEQTVSGRCTITRESTDFDEAGLQDEASRKITLTCNVREPADFVVEGKRLVVAVRPQAIVTAEAGGSVRWANVCLPAD